MAAICFVERFLFPCKSAVRCSLIAAVIAVIAAVTAVQAQTDYYYNPPTGVDATVNTWDTTNADWNTINQTSPPTPANDYVWQNDTVTNGGERATSAIRPERLRSPMT